MAVVVDCMSWSSLWVCVRATPITSISTAILLSILFHSVCFQLTTLWLFIFSPTMGPVLRRL